MKGEPRLARQRLTPVWAALAVGLAALSSLVISLAVNAVPKSWSWAHNWWLLIGIGACLLVVAILVALLQIHSSAGNKSESRSGANAPRADRNSVAGSNSGAMISAEAVYIGAIGTSDPVENSAVPLTTHSQDEAQESRRLSPFVQHQGVGAHGRSDDRPNSDRQTRSGLVLRATKVTKSGESIDIEIFNTATAKQWILNDPWGHVDSFGAADDK